MEQETGTIQGTVRRFDPTKGYGFIQVEGIPEDIFVYHASIKMLGFRTLDAGDVVEFRLARGEKGLKAEDVVKVDAVSKSPQALPEPGNEASSDA